MKAIDLFFFPFHKMVKDEYKKPLAIASTIMTVAQIVVWRKLTKASEEFDQEMQNSLDLLERTRIFPEVEHTPREWNLDIPEVDDVLSKHEAASDLQAQIDNDPDVEPIPGWDYSDRYPSQ